MDPLNLVEPVVAAAEKKIAQGSASLERIFTLLERAVVSGEVPRALQALLFDVVEGWKLITREYLGASKNQKPDRFMSIVDEMWKKNPYTVLVLLFIFNPVGMIGLFTTAMTAGFIIFLLLYIFVIHPSMSFLFAKLLKVPQLD